MRNVYLTVVFLLKMLLLYKSVLLLLIIELQSDKLNFKINFLWKLPDAISGSVDVIKPMRSCKKTERICKGFTNKYSHCAQRNTDEALLCKVNGFKLSLHNKKEGALKNEFISSRLSYSRQDRRKPAIYMS